MTSVYVDHAASTPTDPRVVESVLPYFNEKFGNPSSLHSFGRQAADVIAASSQRIAEFINAKPEDIFYTGSGTESNNLAILGVAKANKNKGKHIITSTIEHPSILNACKALEKDDYKISYLSVNKNGEIDTEELKRTITEQTILVTTHYGNSEIGTLQNIEAIGTVCNILHVPFHVDACQAMAYEKIDVEKMHIDLLTFNGSKMYGPKGVSVLYVREGINIFPIVYGGGQQKSLHSGTENVPGIVGLAKACEIAKQDQKECVNRIRTLRDQLEKACTAIRGVSLNISSINRLPNHLSVRLDNRKNSDLVRDMDRLGIAVSAGSACSSTSITDSHVLGAIGLTSQQAQSTLRITLGKYTVPEDIAKIIQALQQVAK